MGGMGGIGDTCRILAYTPIEHLRPHSPPPLFLQEVQALYGLCVQVADTAGWRWYTAACIISSGAHLSSQ